MGVALTPLEQAIYKTLAYFDIFNHPLTLLELRRYLFFTNQSATLAEIAAAVRGTGLSRFIEQRDGFYMLTGRGECVAIRHHRYVLAQKKFAIAQLACRWLRLLGFVRGVAVCNSLGYSNATRESDVDVVIMATSTRLWLVRLWAIIITTLLGIRLHSSVKRDKVCLSFYITPEAQLASVAHQPVDIYLLYWLATLTPLYGAGAWQQWMDSQLPWASHWLPHLSGYQTSSRRLVHDTAYSSMNKKILEFSQGGTMGAGMEQTAERLQRSRLLPQLIARSQRDDGAVVLSDTMLKFHLSDRRLEIFDQWQQRLKRAMLAI
jgi:hypothetical protein